MASGHLPISRTRVRNLPPEISWNRPTRQNHALPSVVMKFWKGHVVSLRVGNVPYKWVHGILGGVARFLGLCF